MVQIIECPTAKLPDGWIIVFCQVFFDPAYDYPAHYLYRDKAAQEQHCLQLTKERHTITCSEPFCTVVEEGVYKDILKSGGVLEGSCCNPPHPFPYDQDKV